VLISPLPWVGRSAPNGKGETLSSYRAALADLSNENEGIYVVHGTKLVPDESQYFVDNVHPNEAGFEQYAQKLLPVMRRALNVE